MSLAIHTSTGAVDSHDLTVYLLEADERPSHLPSAALDDAVRDPVLVYGNDQRVGVVVIGEGADLPETLRVAAGRAAGLARRARAERVALATSYDGPDRIGAVVEGFVLGGYRFDAYRRVETPPVSSLTLLGDGAARHEAAARSALSRAESVCFARDLVNRSPHEKSAPLLADSAREMAEDVGLRCEVWDRDRIEGERMGGLLAVNRGSVDPPRFVILEHAPPGTAGNAPVVLVGKAVVFDTGGLSLKPTKGSMDKMKGDMAGGAAVIGIMRALALTEAPVRVIALIPMTDNRPGGNAYVPGDVVTMRSGATVEVLNTDAEGRMLLADALDYARELNPRFVVDLATLTGSAVVALGDRIAAVMAGPAEGTDALADAIVQAGRATGEYVHPMPMYPFFEDLLKSDVADLKNVGPREGGAITAAKFLERFTRDADGQPAYPWLHVDIAGPAFTDSTQPYRPVGGTGFGVRLLLEMLASLGREIGGKPASL